jgi:hypothetical protein
MSNLNSLFDVQAGVPPNGYSALQAELPQKTAESPTLTEGKVCKVENAAGSPVFTALTSALVQATDFSVNVPDVPWLVIQGADQSDVTASGKMVALMLKTGIIFKVATALAWTTGALVRANAGVLAAVTAGTAAVGMPGAVEYSLSQQSFGQVLEYSAGSGYVVVAS